MSYCPFCLSAVQTEVCPYCGNSVSYTGDPMHLQVGYVLNGMHPYVLGASLGQGGFGITYIALDIATNRRVAIKEYFPTYCAGRNGDVTVASYRGQEEIFSKGKERFLDEARMLKSLSDLPGVVDVIDFFEINNSAYLVMEFLEGKSLKDHVEQHGRIPAPTFLKQLKPLMADMEKMHRRGVIHRDIAPDNIIMLPDGQLKLIDFGAARSYVGDKSMTVVVKKGFAPVEQYMRKGGNASTDIYALAATIYFCITGIIPPDSAERQYGEAELLAPTSLGVELSREQERALEKALEIQPKDRIQSVAELAKALTQVPKPVTPEPEKAKPVPKKAKVQKSQPAAAPKEEPKKKTKWWIPVAAAMAVLCIGAGLLFAGKDAPSASEESVQMEVAQTRPVETEKVVQLSAEAVKYNEAVDLFKNGEYGKAAIAFGKLGDYRDAKEISRQIWDAIADRKTMEMQNAIYAVKEDGTVVCGKIHGVTQADVSSWTDVIAISRGESFSYVAGLRSDGTVLLSGAQMHKGIQIANYQIEDEGWTDIVEIELVYDRLVYGLKLDGTLVCHRIGTDSDAEQIEKISSLRDIIKIKSAEGELWAWTADGTVLRDFEPYEDQSVIDVDGWSHVVGILKNDGTIAFQPAYKSAFKETAESRAEWFTTESQSLTNIASFNVFGQGITGFQVDGTVVGLHAEEFNKASVDIVALSETAALKADGTLLVAGDIGSDYMKKLNAITDIRLPTDRDALLATIKLNYITNEDVVPEAQSVMEESELAVNTYYIAANSYLDTGSEPYHFFWGQNTWKRNQITTITFVDSLDDAPSDAVDVSANEDSSVLAWMDGTGHLIVGANGKISPEIAPKFKTDGMFSNFNKLRSINFGTNFDISEVTSLHGMFSSCVSLKELDLSSLDTSNLRNMEYMFSDCTSLKKVNFGSFDTSNVISMYRMFSGCKSLVALDLGNFDTSKANNMLGMFEGCRSLKKLDLSSFNTSNVTNMGYMFAQCSSLKELDLSSFNISDWTYIESMFDNCPAKRPDWYHS